MQSALKLIAFAALVVLASGTASAVPQLTITSGASSIVAVDGGANDSDGIANGLIVISNVVVGDFRISGSSATDPTLPASNQNTNQFTVQNTVGGNSAVTFDFFENDYTLQVVGFRQDLTLNPNVPGGTATAVYDQYVNGVLEGTATAGPSSIAPTSDLGNIFAASPGAPYSLRQVVTLSFTNAAVGAFSGFTAQLTPVVVPEPNSVALFGSLLIGVGTILRKKFTAR